MRFSFKSFLFQAVLGGLAALPASGQIITILAGNGTGGYTGNGGPATLASLACPDDIALDSKGNVFIADACSNTVRRVDAATGIISTYAGLYTQMNVGGYSGDGGPATQALLFYPAGIAFDSQDNLYIADYYNCVIRKVSAATGIISTVVGDGSQGYSGDGGPALLAELNCPSLVRFDNWGNMLIADTGNNVIRQVNTATGAVSTVVGFYPGNPGYSGDGGPATGALLNGCDAMMDDPSGNLWVVDANNNVVREVDRATGVISTMAGNGALGYSGNGGPATLASLNLNDGIEVYDNGNLCFDRNGNLFITDDWNNVVRRVDGATDIISTVVGQGPPVAGGFSGMGGPPLLAQLNHTVSLCFDSSCDLLVVDYGNNVVWKVTDMAPYCMPSATPTPSPTATRTPTSTPTPTATSSSTATSTPTAGLASGADTVEVGVYNEAGELIQTLKVLQSTQSVSSLTLQGNSITSLEGPNSQIEVYCQGILVATWDGMAGSGNPVSNGAYFIKVDNVDPTGTVSSLTQQVTVSRNLAQVSAVIYNEAGEAVRHLAAWVADPSGASMSGVLLSSTVLVPGSGAGGPAILQILVQSSGLPVTLSWDGTNDSGALVTAGTYLLSVHWDNGQGGVEDISRDILVVDGPGRDSGGVTACPNFLSLSTGQTRVLFKDGSNPVATLRVGIYAVSGELVARVDGATGAGQAAWDASGVASGLYLAAVEQVGSNGGTGRPQILKIVVLR